MNVRSVTQRRFGAVALNSRFTRSGCLAAVGPGRVVFTRLLRVALSIPAARMSRPIWSRPISIPLRRAVFQSVTSSRVRTASLTARADGHGSSRRSTCSEPPATGCRWLDSERAIFDDVGLVRVDERDYFQCWRSSSAPKKDAALFRISFARRNSRTSCSSSRTRRASAVLTPATWPSSTSACLATSGPTRPRNRAVTRPDGPFHAPSRAPLAESVPSEPPQPSPPENTDVPSASQIPDSTP